MTEDADSVPPIPVENAIDAHVHLFPERLVQAVRDALYEEAGWRFEHPTSRNEMEAELRAAGVARYVALPYVHEAGRAAALNEWLLDQAADSDMAMPFATVHGDDDVAQVVESAFEAGARGLKFQCPVQGSGPADPRLDPAFELAAEYDRPIVFHAGTAPMFADSPHVGADQFEQFVESYPDVRACAAHLGAFEVERFVALAAEHESVFLDTAVALSAHTEEFIGFDPTEVSDDTLDALAGSVLYGTDYPQIPYPYDAERAGLLDRDLADATYRALFRGAAERFLGER